MDFVTPAFSSLPGLEGTQGQSAKSPQAAEGMEVTTVIATFTMHCGGGVPAGAHSRLPVRLL